MDVAQHIHRGLQVKHRSGRVHVDAEGVDTLGERLVH